MSAWKSICMASSRDLRRLPTSVMLAAPRNFAVQRGHFDSGCCCFESLIAALQAGAVESLLQGFAGEDAEGVGDAGVLLGLADAASDFVVDGFVVSGFSANETAERDDGVEPASLGELAGGGGNLPGAGNAGDLDVVAPGAAAEQCIERALEQAVGDDGVPAGGDDGEAHAFGAEVAFERDGVAASGS
jgi:hypothetical protein